MDELEDGEGWGGRRWGVRDGRGGEPLSPRVKERWATKSTHVRFQCDVAPSLPRSHVSQPLFQFDQFRTGGPYFNKKNHHARGRFCLTCAKTGRPGPYMRGISSAQLHIWARARTAGRGPGSGNASVQIPTDICTEHHIYMHAGCQACYDCAHRVISSIRLKH